MKTFIFTDSSLKFSLPWSLMRRKLLKPYKLIWWVVWLRAGRSGDRIPVGARFFAPDKTGPGAHPPSYRMGTGSFPGGKERPGRDADPSHPSSAVCHERVELYLYSPYGPYGLYKGALYLLYKHRHICVCSYMSFIIIYGNVTDGNFSN